MGHEYVLLDRIDLFHLSARVFQEDPIAKITFIADIIVFGSHERMKFGKFTMFGYRSPLLDFSTVRSSSRLPKALCSAFTKLTSTCTDDYPCGDGDDCKPQCVSGHIWGRSASSESHTYKIVAYLAHKMCEQDYYHHGCSSFIVAVEGCGYSAFDWP